MWQRWSSLGLVWPRYLGPADEISSGTSHGVEVIRLVESDGLGPTILLNSWRRYLPTPAGEATDLETLNRSYIEAVRLAGGVPIIAPHPHPAEIPALLDAVDGVVITGGQDLDPAVYGAEMSDSRDVSRSSDESDIALFAAAADANIPVLGICRGLQVINIAYGGDMVQQVQANGSVHHPTYEEMVRPLEHRHPIDVEPDSRLASIYGATSLVVNSLHHQSLNRVADSLRPTAVSPEGLVEAVESLDGVDLLAVQWHPELLDPAEGGPLFDDLVRRAEQHRSNRLAAGAAGR